MPLRVALSAAGRLAAGLMVLLAAVWAWGTPAAAHKPSDSYLALTVNDNSVHGQWEIALRDLEDAIGLDADGDGAITWGEVTARQAAIVAYALPRLTLSAAAASCDSVPADLLIADHSDGAYAVLMFTARCPQPIGALTLDYRLLFDLDAQHRGLVKVDRGGQVAAAILATGHRTWSAAAERQAFWPQVRTFAAAGAHHIWTGFDHLLFLVALLLPAVMRYEGGHWRPVGRLSQSLAEVAKVVTAFTIAHSLTLALATLGLVDVPPRVVMPLIALSIVAAALNNIRPVVTRGLWLVAFAFGLIHGIGFAGALTDLGLAPHDLLVPLISFNLGVEAGQAVVVALVLPAAFLLRATAFYRRAGLAGGSAVIACIGMLWMVEATFAVALLV